MDWIKQHKTILIIVLLVILLLVLIFAVMNTSTNNQPVAETTPAQTQTSESPNISPEEVIKEQVATPLSAIITVPYEITRVKVYSDMWAMVQVTSPNADPANVIIKKEHGVWKPILGPGTYFDEESLLQINAPDEVKIDSNSNNY